MPVSVIRSLYALMCCLAMLGLYDIVASARLSMKTVTLTSSSGCSITSGFFSTVGTPCLELVLLELQRKLHHNKMATFSTPKVNVNPEGWGPTDRYSTYAKHRRLMSI
jgi:hypothetical protein